jgi:shikimate kinase
MYTGPPIVIAGFIGAGKSTVAVAVAEELSCPLVDLDEVVTQQTGRTPAEIIDDEGELSFRLTEGHALESIMRANQSAVIALGGGTWLNEQNRQLIQNYKATTFWLDAPFELCWSRINIGGGDRPLARNEQDARELFQVRLPIYALAQYRIEVTPQKSIEEIAKEIMRALRGL